MLMLGGEGSAGKDEKRYALMAGMSTEGLGGKYTGGANLSQ